ncbi:hypothetical protein QN277_017117 [Acacia crassicarpa]|uniref:WRKY domain-containing protein n=1 Tax=Acacia crassicarpa TaxID=499986 RepID=A0AAE1JNJ3_9FABA|nr:hypothetical protein QN277_017117 [Acacia crassicarpa]
MRALCPEHVSANKESIIGELVEGKECASQLKLLFQNPSGPHDTTPSAQQLVAKILTSFTQSISVLTSSEAGGEILEISCNDRRPDESGQSRKRSPPPAKDRRGCYKRRKAADTRTKISQTMEDEYEWRKYGQKKILNSKFPRSYFRCTRKHDQGCKAVKQVQRREENPEMFLTMYIGVHTCKDNLKAPEMVTDSGIWESYLAPTESNKASNDDQKASSSSTPNMKQEYPKVDTPLSEITDNSDPNLWPNLKDFELLEPLKMSDNLDFGVDQSVGFGTDHHLDFEY